MIIDFHTHPCFAGSPATKEAISPIIAAAKIHGIEQIVALGDVVRYGISPSPHEIRAINDDTLALMRWFPDVVIGFCHLNPLHDEAFIDEETKRCITDNGMRGIKLEISVNGRDRRVNKVLERAESLGVPLLQHAWDTTIIGDRRHQTDPADVAVMARRFPRVNIVMAHLTACGLRGVQTVRDFPNVYMDTSGSQPFSGIIEYAVEHLGAKRILYGSDIPIRDFPSQLGRITGAKLQPEQKEQILHKNAERLLGLNATTD